MFEVPESDIVQVRIDDDVIYGKKPIEFIRSSNKKNEAIDASNENNKSNQSDNLQETEPKSKAQTYA